MALPQPRLPECWPTSSDEGFRRWDLAASWWSRSEPGEDSIKIIQHDGEWSACTEYDQCVHRDLTADDIASIRAEFYLAGEL